MWLRFGLLMSYFFIGISNAGQTCNLAFNSCPGNFTSGTVTVPQSIIWLDPKIPFCSENVQIQTGTNAAVPSIVFIIDHSGSMDQNDKNKDRFTVTNGLLDSIYKVQPATKVGLVVFNRRLIFDYREDAFFKPVFPGDTSQYDSYVPLTTLNQKYANGRKGIDTLKAYLSLDKNTDSDLIHVTKLPAKRISSNTDYNTTTGRLNTRGGTDISLGFEGAKAALIGDKTVKENQYFIFLSDGDTSTIDISRKNKGNDWVIGDNTPTTFTIFFKQGTNPTAPASIVKMTENIRLNGYSSQNTNSAYWAINLEVTKLVTLLQTNVLNPIFANTPAKAKSATLAAGGVNYSNSSIDSKNFVFPKRIPLAPDQTSIQLSYVYSYTDSGKSLEKTVPYTLNIKRSGTATLASGLATSCQDQADITLSYNGTNITKVTADYNDLGVHVAVPASNTCANCKVLVSPNKSVDKETIALNPNGGVQSGSFKRETSTNIVAGDGKLQHLPTDSIIIVWTNPENVLDIVRKSFPYTDIGTALQVINHNYVAQADNAAPFIPGQHFTLIAPTSLNATPGTVAEKNWNIIQGPLNPLDSLKYVGVGVEASRAFKVSIRIYTNLGEFVNKIEFALTQAEFEKLAKGIKNNTRTIRVLWDNRAQDGSQVGTGGYIMKTDVTLLKVAGIAEDNVLKSEYRRVGVVRSQ